VAHDADLLAALRVQWLCCPLANDSKRFTNVQVDRVRSATGSTLAPPCDCCENKRDRPKLSFLHSPSVLGLLLLAMRWVAYALFFWAMCHLRHNLTYHLHYYLAAIHLEGRVTDCIPSVHI